MADVFGKLTWNGVSLLVPDPDGELEQWLAQFHRIEDVIAFCATETAAISSNNAPRSHVGTGITTPNYPELGPLKLNQLVWPTGATRFGYFLAAVPSDDNDVGRPGSFGTLILSDGERDATVTMQLLAYRPISKTNLSLLVLVDKRYSWQYLTPGNIITASGYPMLDKDGTFSGTPNNDYGQLQISYSEVFDALQEVLGAIDHQSVTGFLVPDPLELSNRKNFNAAQMLDAVAQSCGLRVWLDFDGTIHARNSSLSYTSNFNDTENLIAGGEEPNQTPKPANVIVNFRRASQYRAYADNDIYSQSVSIGGDGGAITVESCAYAHWYSKRDNYSNAPDNAGTLTGLATNIGTTLGAWYAKTYDATFDGIKTWTITGFDNVLTIDYASQVQNDANDVPLNAAMAPLDGERFDINYYRFTTRVQSMPANFGSYINLSQDPSIRFLRGIQWGKLTEDQKQPIDKTTPQAVEVQIWQLNAKWAEQATSIKIQAYDVSLSTDVLAKGDRVYLWFHEVNRQWNIAKWPEEQAIVRVTGTSNYANLSQKNAVCIWPGSVVTYNTAYPGCSGSQYQPKSDIWLAVINNDGEKINVLPTGDRFLGKPVGTYEISGDSRPLYVIRAEHYLVRFQLTQPMVCGQESPPNNALQLYWNGTEYVLSSQAITVVDPYVAQGAMFEGQPQSSFQLGYRGFAEWRPDRRVYEIVFMQRPAQWIRFKTRPGQTLSLASPSVQANVVDFWGGKNPDPGSKGIKVYQMPGTAGGVFAAPPTAVGYAVYDDYADQYNIVFIQTWPQFVTGKIAIAVSAGIGAGSVLYAWGPVGFVPITGETVTILDKTVPKLFVGKVDKQYRGTWSAADNAYILEWVECDA